MVQQIIANNCKAIKVSESNNGMNYYRCNVCGDMFGHMVHFEEWDFYTCIPRKCPNCGLSFSNGMKEI